jgi:hypothetical protein
MPTSSAFGLRIRSDRPIPGLPAAPRAPGWDVEVVLGKPPSWARRACAAVQPAEPWYVSPRAGPDAQPTLRIWKLPDAFRLAFTEGAEFLVDSSATRVWARWTAPLTLEDAATYLLGPVLGFLLTLRGSLCLHGSAVAAHGRAFALVGPSGAGKSTLAAALARRGQAVLTDDITALRPAEPDFLVQPGYPRLRLWPESVQVLYGAADALPPLTPTWDKRYVDLTDAAYRFQSRPLPLAAVYLLGERCAGAEPALAPLLPRDGLVGLAANRYFCLPEQADHARAFAFLGRLVASVPVRRVRAPAGADRLPGLCAAILADVAALPSSPEGPNGASTRV